MSFKPEPIQNEEKEEDNNKQFKYFSVVTCSTKTGFATLTFYMKKKIETKTQLEQLGKDILDDNKDLKNIIITNINYYKNI